MGIYRNEAAGLQIDSRTVTRHGQVATRQTVEWLDKHDIPYWDLCFMQEKAAVGADLYIEDAPHNISRLRADGNKTIVFTNFANKDLDPPRADNWEQVVEMVLREQKDWLSGLD